MYDNKNNLFTYHPKFYVPLFILFCALSILLHLKSFTVRHIEGDEIVYLTLAREVNWDLSHYTTMDDPRVSQFPYGTYQAPLFIHPPLFPLILKIGYALGNPVMVGLIFQNLAMIFLLFFVWRVCVFLDISKYLVPIVFATFIFCPLLLFDTTRLHMDGLLAIFVFCGISLYIEALYTESVPKAFYAGLILITALNIKFQAVLILPPLLFIQVAYLYRKRYIYHEKKQTKPFLTDLHNWKCFSIVMILVLTIGLQHYYRVLFTFGNLMPWKYWTATGDPTQWNAFLKSMHMRTRPDMFFYLLSTFPILMILGTRFFFKSMKYYISRNKGEIIYFGMFIYLLTCAFIYQYTVMRYFALVFPFFYICIPLIIEVATEPFKKIIIGGVGVSLLLMITTGFFNTIVFPETAKIVPSLIYYIPFLQHFYM